MSKYRLYLIDSGGIVRSVVVTADGWYDILNKIYLYSHLGNVFRIEAYSSISDED